MTDYDTPAEEGIDLGNPRHVRALTGVMTVLDEAPGLYTVVSGSGKEYVVDLDDESACTCPDFTYRSAAAEGDIEGFVCKHIVRAQAETGRLTIPAYVDLDALDEHFGKFVAESPKVAAPIAVTDGGVTVGRELESVPDERPADCECGENGTVACWPCYAAGFAFDSPNPDAGDDDDVSGWDEVGA